jgi:hypothetical protein
MALYITTGIIVLIAGISGCLIGAWLVKKKKTWDDVCIWVKSVNWDKWLSKSFLTSIAAGVVTAGAAFGFDWEWLYGIAAAIPIAYAVILRIYDSIAEAVAEEESKAEEV